MKIFIWNFEVVHSCFWHFFWIKSVILYLSSQTACQSKVTDQSRINSPPSLPAAAVTSATCVSLNSASDVSCFHPLRPSVNNSWQTWRQWFAEVIWFPFIQASQQAAPPSPPHSSNCQYSWCSYSSQISLTTAPPRSLSYVSPVYPWLDSTASVGGWIVEKDHKSGPYDS